ncbi:MAG: GNAT family N-acetyltransferase [Chloroflexi bacterium AL-W]|nr:GNAT family N-acetyltransferase [Chloroflexi bacterium AL-N1]NOK69204.1 GNAT family N-acetyltransferase [Chloroflexi bacterium AL-N10]NOK77187.1 GNAT family N-acetyltransferase [Chloroflexi bacterium AL-N5]NOK83832.1 GNAT family N-acetyltransferase [Chloroflexi bacterium AL-W]NOK91042.1 GNAT family N-acetyltransferase [Chloroflexi bacterium AL-N15]
MMLQFARLTRQPSDLTQLAAWLADLNQQPQHHIGYLGTEPAEIAQSIQDFDVLPHKAWIVAHAGQELVGALGFDIDLDAGRTWLYGPFANHSDWPTVADGLWSNLQPLLPQITLEHELFCNEQHANCIAFAERHGFRQHSHDFIWNFHRGLLAQLSETTAEVLTELYYEAVCNLHDQIFPGTYYSGQEILNRLNDQRRMFIATDNGQLLGYAYVEVEPAFGDGSIEFIGVDNAARGRGIGSQLMAASLQWMFSFETVQEINLTVNAENQRALGLYRRVGFQHAHTMCSFRKIVEK